MPLAATLFKGQFLKWAIQSELNVVHASRWNVNYNNSKYFKYNSTCSPLKTIKQSHMDTISEPKAETET